jgi:hypothetical protein
MARQCPRGHDGTKPGEVADNMLANHLTRRAPDLSEEMAKQLEIKLEVATAEIQSIGGKGDESTQGQSTRSHGQAGAPLHDLSIATHLDGGLRQSSSESSTAAAGRCSRQSGREEVDESKRGGAASRSGRSHLVGFDPVGWCRQVRPARQVGQV